VKRAMAVAGAQERLAIYAALAITCAVIALAASPLAGLWAFVQVATMMELSGRQHARQRAVGRHD